MLHHVPVSSTRFNTHRQQFFKQCATEGLQLRYSPPVCSCVHLHSSSFCKHFSVSRPSAHRQHIQQAAGMCSPEAHHQTLQTRSVVCAQLSFPNIGIQVLPVQSCVHLSQLPGCDRDAVGSRCTREFFHDAASQHPKHSSLRLLRSDASPCSPDCLPDFSSPSPDLTGGACSMEQH